MAVELVGGRRSARTKVVVLALDGLSWPDFYRLVERMPRSAPALRAGASCRLDAGLMTGAAAIWAEVLTGVPWYENGCAAHAVPSGSLNRTRVLSERDLAAPVTLLSADATQLFVNVPLVEPLGARRGWLSDGSLPAAAAVAPSSLLELEMSLRGYAPRPYPGIAEVIGCKPCGISACVANELARIKHARRLLRRRLFEQAVIRLTIFDQLAHLLGADFLAAAERVDGDTMARFLKALDRWLSDLLSEVQSVVILSPFSHVRCTARVSLNAWLEQGGFLTRGRPDAAAQRRASALAAIEHARRVNDGEASDVRPPPPAPRSLLDPARTIAAAPVEGCVFVNSSERFKDGTVAPRDVEGTREAVREHLERMLARSCEDAATVCPAADDPRNPNAPDRSLLPELFVHVPGAELHNNPDPFFARADRPRSVHAPGGFLWLRSGELPPSARTADIESILQQGPSMQRIKQEPERV